MVLEATISFRRAPIDPNFSIPASNRVSPFIPFRAVESSSGGNASLRIYMGY